MNPDEFYVHKNGGGKVYGNAQVDENVFLCPETSVKGNATIKGKNITIENSLICDNVQIEASKEKSSLKIKSVSAQRNAFIFSSGKSSIIGSSREKNIIISGDAFFDLVSATIRNTTRSTGNLYFTDDIIITDNVTIIGNGYGYIGHSIRICDNARLEVGRQNYSGNYIFKKDMVCKYPPLSITRSDGYTFIILPDSKGIPHISAGCRYFTLPEARKHWNKSHEYYKESNIILDSLEVYYKTIYKKLIK